MFSSRRLQGLPRCQSSVCAKSCSKVRKYKMRIQKTRITTLVMIETEAVQLVCCCSLWGLEKLLWVKKWCLIVNLNSGAEQLPVISMHELLSLVSSGVNLFWNLGVMDTGWRNFENFPEKFPKTSKELKFSWPKIPNDLFQSFTQKFAYLRLHSGQFFLFLLKVTTFGHTFCTW